MTTVTETKTHINRTEITGKK